MVDDQQRDARAREVKAWYDGYFFKCQLFREKFDAYLARAVRQAGLPDARVESRAKTVDSLVTKALKVDASGEFKYVDPRREIADLVGARVMVPLSTDIPPVADLVRRMFEVEEELERGAEEGQLDIPGYRSLHFIVRLRSDALAEPDLAPFADMVVGIQVRTILQHAWAMLQHDVMYKADRPASPVVRRRLVALAGLLELADREFVDVRGLHVGAHHPVPRERDRPEERLTATSLRHLAETLFGEKDSAAHEWFVELKAVTDSLDLTTVGDLESSLADWLPRARAVAERARQRTPWLNTALLMDLLLRLALNEKYFDARPPEEADDYDPAQIDQARTNFLAEVDEMRRELESTA